MELLTFANEPNTFQALSLTPNINIANIVLGHQRPHYNGTHQMDAEKIEITSWAGSATLEIQVEWVKSKC